MFKRLLVISLMAVCAIATALIPCVESTSVYAASLSSNSTRSVQIQQHADTASNLVQDGGFENQTTNTVSAPWSVEGAGSQGIDTKRPRPGDPGASSCQKILGLSP